METTANSSAILDSASGGMWDLLLVGVIILVAVFYLYRKLWTNRGQCAACASSNGDCAGACATKIEFDETTPSDSLAGQGK